MQTAEEVALGQIKASHAAAAALDRDGRLASIFSKPGFASKAAAAPVEDSAASGAVTVLWPNRERITGDEFARRVADFVAAGDIKGALAFVGNCQIAGAEIGVPLVRAALVDLEKAQKLRTAASPQSDQIAKLASASQITDDCPYCKKTVVSKVLSSGFAGNLAKVECPACRGTWETSGNSPHGDVGDLEIGRHGTSDPLDLIKLAQANPIRDPEFVLQRG